MCIVMRGGCDVYCDEVRVVCVVRVGVYCDEVRVGSGCVL